MLFMPFPVAERSKARVCSRLLAGIAGSNPARLSVCCKCCGLSGKSLCDELIPRPEEFYRLWHVIVCDLETSARRPWPTLGRCAKGMCVCVCVHTCTLTHTCMCMRARVCGNASFGALSTPIYYCNFRGIGSRVFTRRKLSCCVC